jgi:hypothetical protein
VRIKIDVTDRHIRDGRPGVCARCPVALALVDHPAIRAAFAMGPHCLVIHTLDATVHYTCPPRSVARFIRRFDVGKSTDPFSFFVRYDPHSF